MSYEYLGGFGATPENYIGSGDGEILAQAERLRQQQQLELQRLRQAKAVQNAVAVAPGAMVAQPVAVASVKTCDAYVCPTHPVLGQLKKETKSFYYNGNPLLARALIEGDARFNVCNRASCAQNSSSITGEVIQQTQCCPDPVVMSSEMQQWYLKLQNDLLIRKANATTDPEGTVCGSSRASGVTQMLRSEPICVPGTNCTTPQQIPTNCVKTGRWYSADGCEMCCSTSSTTPPEVTPIVTAPPQVQQTASQSTSPWVWLAFGAGAIGLIWMLSKRSA